MRWAAGRGATSAPATSDGRLRRVPHAGIQLRAGGLSSCRRRDGRLQPAIPTFPKPLTRRKARRGSAEREPADRCGRVADLPAPDEQPEASDPVRSIVRHDRGGARRRHATARDRRTAGLPLARASAGRGARRETAPRKAAEAPADNASEDRQGSSPAGSSPARCEHDLGEHSKSRRPRVGSGRPSPGGGTGPQGRDGERRRRRKARSTTAG